MNVKEALTEIGRYTPCPHDDVDTRLGNGLVWARCNDCGETVKQESLGRLRRAHGKFMEAMATVHDALDVLEAAQYASNAPRVHDPAMLWSQCTTADF